MDNSKKIAVVGLGYVGLPLAVEFGKKFKTVGFDLKESLIESYKKFTDPTEEVSTEDLKAAVNLECTADPSAISDSDYIIVAVPTPVNEAHQPDLSPLVSSSETVGKHMKKGAIVIYESTVFPGATEDICVPVLEKFSGMKWKEDFFVGYSPERINPGDKERTLTKIVKVVSGDTPETLDIVRDIYAAVIEAGVYPTKSIKEAEAAKVIENTQRDLNIALINELSVIFDRLGIDTLNVLEAAGTKWNFLPFRPGLVGGHCIGVDPYYLTHKAQTIGYHPEVILAGRRINDNMGKFVAEKTVKKMIGQGIGVKGAKIAVLGLTFKEDCPDLRNTRVIDIVAELRTYGIEVLVHDPLADPVESVQYYGIELTEWDKIDQVDGLIIATAHKEYKDMAITDFTGKMNGHGTLVDVKSILDPEEALRACKGFWRL